MKIRRLSYLVSSKIFNIAVASALIVTTFPGSSRAVGAATFTLTPSVTTYNVGDIFSIVILENSDAEYVNASQVDLTYDDTKLQYISADVSSGDFAALGPAPSGGGGNIAITAATITPIKGTRTVATVAFKAIATTPNANISIVNTSAIVRASDSTDIWDGSSVVSSLTINAHNSNSCDYTVSNTGNSGAGSLRQAIIDANSNSNSSGICFSIGNGLATINLITPLPAITQQVTIDGTTQPGFVDKPIVEISGNSIPNTPGSNMGLRITGNSVNGTEIRGLIINGFREQGIFLDASGVKIVGNYIGLDSTGGIADPNGTDGIGIYSAVTAAPASNNIIGGSVFSDRNIISGNSGNGVAITAEYGTSRGIASNNIVIGNFIGTNSTGTAVIANTGDGVLVNSVNDTGTASANRIGGTLGTIPDGPCSGECNLISGNGANGLGTWFKGTAMTLIEGNYIGTNVNGSASLANGNIGAELNESPNNTIGTGTPSGRNIISGNNGAGVFITGAEAKNNTVKGNFIGTDKSGTSMVANKKMGLSIGPTSGPPSATGSANNTIGGTSGTTPNGSCAGDCNLISGNYENGILIAAAESGGNQILGNFIGVDMKKTAALPNKLDGIGLLNTPNMLIGNGADSGKNIVAGNQSNGIIAVGGASTGNRITGNDIGLVGIGNNKNGVAISGAVDTAILNNAITDNGLLGIDLDNNGAPNLNDPNDLDGGANRLQNFPNIYSARTIGGSTKIGGNFNGAPNTSFELQFFSSNGCNASVPYNYGEGQNYIGSTQISTDIFGNTAFGFSPAQQVSGGKYITATATKKINGIPAETSEFSQCVLVNVAKIALTNGATWFLKNDLTNGVADKTFGYGFPSSYLLCAWDSNQPGVKLPVVFSGGTWFMRASYTTGKADLTMQYGFNGATPVCGDWNGDGVDTVGLYSGGTWFLRNSNASGTADITFGFGSSNTKPVVGDWNGDGVDTIGYVVNDNLFNLRNSNNSGTADAGSSISYGFVPGYPVSGDWNGDGVDTIGSVSAGGTWSLRNSNNSGPSEVSLQFGFPGAVPIVW